MKLQSKRITALIAFMLVALIANAETLLLNNRQFEKIDGQWYQIDRSFKYLVDYTVITVKYKDSVTDVEKDAKNQALGCSVIRVNTLGYYDLRIPEGSDPLQVVQDYMSSELVKIAEPNAIGVFNAESNDPLYPEQWHQHDEILEWGIDSYKAWDKETGNPNIKIAVIDSGSDIFHEDLKGNIWVNPGEDLDGDGVVWDVDDINGVDDDGNGLIDDFVGWDFYNNSNNVTGSFYHGTHVAGITGALSNNSKGVAGVAGGWSVENQGCSMLIASLGPYGEGSVLDDAILYAALNGAKIITLSLGLPPSYAIEDAIETAYQNYGVFINCASGNDYRASLSFPASNEYVVAVGASDKNGLKTSFSNYGEGLKVVAPGVDIWSTRIGNVYNTGNGTSYSSPQVAGTAGLIASRFPSFSNKDIEKVICLTAMKLPYSFDQMKEYGTWNNFVGYGKLNADRALGITGSVTKSQTLVEGNYICGQDVIVTNNAALTCNTNSRTYLFDQTNLTIQTGSSLSFNSNSNFIAEGNSRIVGSVQVADGAHIEVLDNSTLSFQLSQLSITAGTTVKLGTNAKLIIENGTNFTIADGTVIELGEGAEIVVKNKGYLTAISASTSKITFSYTGTTGKWLGINCEGGSSLDLYNVKITGAETGVRGVYNSKFSVRNSVFENCDNGINVSELASTVRYYITGNTLTGTRSGTGVSITTSAYGDFKNNTISFFLYGVKFIMSGAPIVTKNTIFGNKVFGILITGQTSIPMLVNTDQTDTPFPNNQIYSNGNTYSNPSDLFLSAQIGIIPYANVYMHDGKNNIYSGLVNITPIIPCISIAKLIASVNQNIIVSAAYNYWGSSSVNYDYFFEEHFQYSIEYSPYYISPNGLLDPTDPDSQQSSPTENKILTNAIRLESKDNVTPAIKLYEHIIKKYVDTPEYYIAMARLPYLYAIAELDNNELIAIYDEALISDKTTNKKFFKGMKVATHIKGKRYDDAIAVAEEMKTEAEFEEEVTLADINISIANLLKDMEGKSRSSVDYAQNLKELQSKLTGNDSKAEPAGITESVLPAGHTLYQNYPNPFNPVTQIKFDLAKNAQVKLSVYNISGQKVAELANGVMNAGNHAVDFDGSKLNSGVYYYTLEADGIAFTKKMVLTK